MLSILHQIHIVDVLDIYLCQLQTWLFPAEPSYMQLYQNQVFKTYNRQARSPLAYPSVAFII